jgi:uncharacterized protein (DUF983 family)
MRTITEIFRNVIGLFVDDGFLVIAILGVVALTAFLTLELGVRPSLAGAFLLLANVAVLAGSVLRTELAKEA